MQNGRACFTTAHMAPVSSYGKHHSCRKVSCVQSEAENQRKEKKIKKKVDCRHRTNNLALYFAPSLNSCFRLRIPGSKQSGRWSWRRAQHCQTEIRFAPLSISLSPLHSPPPEITLNDICYHQGQPRDRTADAGGGHKS